MSKRMHFLYILLMSTVVITILVVILVNSYAYFTTAQEERFFHADHEYLKPSGTLGHGFGIVGTILMLSGIGMYMMRKRWRLMSRMGLVKHWLEFHIFLCTLGPMLILFHTAMKFGGVVAISFWSMVAVFTSGILGRFIYLQIPRSIEGRELSLSEIKIQREALFEKLGQISHNNDQLSWLIDKLRLGTFSVDNEPVKGFWRKWRSDRRNLQKIKLMLKQSGVLPEQGKKVIGLVKADYSLNRRIDRLETMQNLFHYWHVVHLPFAVVMVIIMIIHVAVTLVFGYRWIF